MNFPIKTSIIISIYMQRLIDLKLANMNGMVQQKKLRNAILEFWREEVLSILQCLIERDKDCSWLNSIVRENNIPSQPIRHILLCRFLGIDIISLLEAENPNKTQIEIWEEKLLLLVNRGLSIREMALQLDSTSKTVRKYLDKHNVALFWVDNGGGKYKYIAFVETQEYIIKHDKAREKWLQLMKEHPDLSRNKLKRIYEELYTRLMRFDKEWVDAYSPTIKMTRESYWNEKEEELLPKVITTVNEMYCG